MTHKNPRKLRRGDVVELPVHDCFLPGRVWRRIDTDHVQVIDVFKHINIFHEDQLKLSAYKGCWKWRRHPGNDEGKTPRWSPMTSLRQLKKMASAYNNHFGGIGWSGQKRTRQERLAALTNRTLWTPRIDVTDIVWDREVGDVDRCVKLPTAFTFAGTVPEHEIADYLSDQYGCCVKSFVATSQPISFPGPMNTSYA